MQLDTDTHYDVQLLELMNTGIFHKNQNGKSIESSGTHYRLAAVPTCNNKVKDCDTVYFATYKKEDIIFADFIEPYFENLDNLRALK